MNIVYCPSVSSDSISIPVAAANKFPVLFFCFFFDPSNCCTQHISSTFFPSYNSRHTYIGQRQQALSIDTRKWWAVPNFVQLYLYILSPVGSHIHSGLFLIYYPETLLRYCVSCEHGSRGNDDYTGYSLRNVGIFFSCAAHTKRFNMDMYYVQMIPAIQYLKNIYRFMHSQFRFNFAVAPLLRKIKGVFINAGLISAINNWTTKSA